ncbi:MAG: hypothetical protein WBC85_17275 [Planktotalea sp.]|uniref:hypothetical protein n=1 Tax=Planktotalea sp. TaxID=2029877 RepID=UPI003C74BFCC
MARFGVFVRSAAELACIAAQNPFPKVAGSKVTAIFLDGLASEALCSGLRGQADEEIMAGAGVIYVHYPNGLGRSKLRILGAEHGSARNMNTVAKMVALTS